LRYDAGGMVETTLAELEHDGKSPPEWTDERLRDAWERCDDVVAVARLAGRTGTLEACAAAQVAVVGWAQEFLPPELRKARDWATQEAMQALDEILACIADCAGGHARATETLPDTCKSIVRAAGLRDWDEGLCEEAHCEAAPWPHAEYETMVDHREAVEQETHRALAAIVRAHVPCPTSTQLREGFHVVPQERPPATG
jgi:hypothetical protein